MSKRAGGLERRKNDYYRTWDVEAVRPLINHLEPCTSFVEPCAGDGVLVDHLEAFGHRCTLKCDIEPKRKDIRRLSAHQIGVIPKGQIVITNPPWTRAIMHPLIEHLCKLAPAWFLFDSDWLFTKQSKPLLPYLRKVVAVGRVRWIEGTNMDGKDNAMWAQFDGTRPPSFTEFHGRV